MGRGSYRKKPGLTPSMLHILTALCEGERHGLGIMDRILELTDGDFQIGPGALYGTLQKLESGGLIAEAGDEPDSRRRYYRITSKGLQQLRSEVERLKHSVGAAEAAMQVRDRTT